MTLDRLWAGWRAPYLAEAGASSGSRECLFERLAAQPDDVALVLERTTTTLTLLNAYPYSSGHVMVAPLRHEADLEALASPEADALMAATQRAIRAIKIAYVPGGINVGLNLGRASGAGVPGHLHVHVLPRWAGDTNFMTSIAEARVLPEALPLSYEKLRGVWPG